MAKFRLNKMGCKHFYRTELVEENVVEISCVYCEIVKVFPKPNFSSLRRRARIEDKIRQDSMASNKKNKAKDKDSK